MDLLANRWFVEIQTPNLWGWIGRLLDIATWGLRGAPRTVRYRPDSNAVTIETANVSIRLLCPPALCLPTPNSGDASLLLSGQFGVPALGDVSLPASRIPVVRWRVFNDSHELMVPNSLGTRLCVPTNPLSKSRTPPTERAPRPIRRNYGRD